MSNKKLFFPFIIALIAITLISSACKKNREGKGEILTQSQSNSLQGLGNNGGTPSGTTFVLPSYITVVGIITGGIPYDKKMEVYDKKAFLPYIKNIYDSIGGYAEYGTGTYVDIVAKFASSLNHDTTLILPGGLIFVDESGVSQNGFILQNIYIPIGAHDTAWTLTKAYCLNLSRHISYDTTIYKFSVVTDIPQLLEVVNIMKTKQPPIGNESGVQDALWNISDFEGLTNENRDFLNSLP